MLRIAMLSYHTCPLATLGGKDTGGMNVYVRDLTCELGRMGIHVDVFTRSQDEHVPHVVHELGFGNRVVHIPAGPEEPKSKSDIAKFIPEFVEGIKQFAAEKNIHYDVIHSHYWMSGLAAEALSDAWGGTPIVHMFHTLGEMKNRVARSEDERAGEDRLKGERQVLGRADRIVVATLAELTQLRFLYRANARKLVVIPPGVDTSHFYPIPADEAKQYIGLTPDSRMVLFVGRIEPLKGVDTLIQAMSCLGVNEIHKPVHLAIIGGEPDVIPEKMSAEMARLQKLCDDLCMGGMVVFLGKRGQDTLPYYYSAAEVLVMPSLYESFGMVALEAMACGTPVIASEVGGLGYLVQDGETGYTIPDSDPEALCNKLSGLLGDAHLRETMGLRAAEYALDYAWSNIAAQIVDVYKGLVEKRSVGVLLTGSDAVRS
ncbi:MAG TPA: glycosyltransferase [Anaerolineales bacterium]|nr:glycosyltransferase [Anaerolineales bacterium]HMV96432.1 glycosyltransferase [Anaerolineales bacterium]HMX18789.1 glycosyltransferase [Anaerolineales bacterium]HMX73807.1 glycosyltransferase [Anaerolineales bacterium]HMZ44396.1 glycosyltransferase [Anaerolineales bacterium]